MAVDFSQSYATGTFNLVTGAVNIQYLTGKVNDTGVGIFIEMKNASNAVVPPSVETMILYATRPDGTKVYFVAEYDGNRMRIDFNNSLYEVSGNVTAEIELIDVNGLKKKSNTFTINAIESVFDASYVRSTDDFRVLKEALDDVKYVEQELQNITPEQINQVTTAEQGRATAEQGRVIAEQGRVTAENNRVATLNAKADKTYVDAQLADIENAIVKSVNNILPDASGNVSITAGGAEIDDTVTSIGKTWSSNKIDSTKANRAQEEWITPTLLNGVTGNIKFLKDTLGFVHFQGYFTMLTKTMLVMPVGYRPSENLSVTTNKGGRLAIWSDGGIRQWDTNAFADNNLNHITYKAV